MSALKKILKIHQPKTKHKLIKEISQRWSPRHFSNKPISKNELKIIFEAGRWTPSAHNYQPWYYYYANKGSQSYQKLFSTLVPYNQSWAKTAPLLILAVAITKHSDEDNPFAFYDLGASVLSLVFQAMSLGIYARQMALFDREKVKKFFKLEKNLEPFIIIALGKIGDYDKAEKEIINMELEPRPRKSDVFKEL